MKLTWIIVRKDLYRLRWVLILWVLVMVGRGLFASIQGSLDEVGYYPFNRAAWLFGSVFFPVLGFGLVMGLQDDDSLADSEVFWITRPISGAMLMTAKSLTLVILWLLPVLITIPFWLSQGYDLKQLGAASCATVKTQFVITMLAVPFAVISPNGPRFLINVFLAAVAVLFLGLTYRLGGLDQLGTARRGVLESRFLLITFLWVFASILVVLIQFLTRRTRYSVVVLSATALCSFGVTCLWTQDIAAAKGDVESPRTPLSDLRFKSATYYANGGKILTPGAILRMESEISGLRPGAIAVPLAVTHSLTWPDGGALRATEHPSFVDRARLYWSAALRIAPTATIHSDINLPVDCDVDQLFRAAPTYSATVEGEIHEPEIVATVRAKAGEKSVRRGIVVKIVSVIETLIPKGPPILEISLSESAPHFSENFMGAVFDDQPDNNPPAYYYLINHEDGRSLLARASPTGELLNSATTGYFRTTLVFIPDRAHAWNGDVPPDMASWVKNATLVKVASKFSSSFHTHQSDTRLEQNLFGWHFPL